MSDDPVRNPFLDGGDQKQGSGHTLAAALWPSKIITVALVQGVLIIGAVFVYLVLGGDPAPADNDAQGDSGLMFPAIGLLFTAGAIACGIALPAALRRKTEMEVRSSGEKISLPIREDAPLTQSSEKMAEGCQRASLVGQAVMEGAAVVNLVLYMLDEHPIHLGLAAICVIGIVLLMPTVAKVRQSIENAAV